MLSLVGQPLLMILDSLVGSWFCSKGLRLFHITFCVLGCIFSVTELDKNEPGKHALELQQLGKKT